MHNNATVTYSLDVAGIVAIVTSLLGWLPPFAALLAIIWYVLQIWESRTIQTWMQKRHERRIVRLAAKLAALQLKSAADSASLELKGAAQAAAQNLKADAKLAAESLTSNPKDLPSGSRGSGGASCGT